MANKTDATLRTFLLNRNSRYCNKILHADIRIRRDNDSFFLLYLVAGADLQFGVERHENRGRGHSDEQKGDGHGAVLRAEPVNLGWHAQNRDSRYKTEMWKFKRNWICLEWLHLHFYIPKF